MSFDPDSIRLEPTNWFAPSVEYRGGGRAEFSEPRGVLRGPTTVAFNEFGHVTAEMATPGIAECEPEFRSVLLNALTGKHPVCTQLSVETSDGVLTAIHPLTVGWAGTLGTLSDEPGDQSRLRRIAFRLVHSRFDVLHLDASEARYWVLPLFNFLSELGLARVEALDSHPLRIYPTPAIPEGLSEEDLRWAFLAANRKNQLIVFRFRDRLGFVERLPDYEKRESELLGCQKCRLVTAVMVGEVGANCIESESLASWFPLDSPLLLSLASGCEVGAPWIEFRDRNGELVRRTHMTLGTPRFARGHRAIHEELGGGMGELLTRAFASEHFGHARLRVAMRHMVRGATYEQPMEDRLDHLCRALERVCADVGLASQSLLERLSERDRGATAEAIKDLASTVRSRARKAVADGHVQDGDVLRHIANRTESRSAYLDRDFGRAVLRLLDHSHLADADVMARHYGGKDNEGRRRWAQKLSDCRNVPTHGGYFDVPDRLADDRQLFATTQHLLDILLRVFLKKLDYEGQYQPSVLRWRSPQRLDWITPDTSPSTLGY